ncbi:polysaccharide deacetylase family protein [Catenulispora sp. NF23]|uniref:Polysaccharide deacetylase family protein n=1 Tax=Catenulispora pinistramenti TaxID=2705254 RepID=A0ABS5KW14_9ACTN|nr:polysaccharide deacetylase family protein [Catenulispora pinistramenti]MBS2537276.1 polysaccharide deacetylase family protein [Catenulispora pinistramenti]MBS2550155.1 polysaccharide deacetylase family protein [Catenulispora pinistramenti]
MNGTELRNISFHGIGTPNGPEREPDEHRYWVTESAFLHVLDLCADHRDTIRLSFDDGNASDAATALPALQERGLTADFFPIADRLGTPGNLDEDALRALAAAGMGIGTHGAAHRPWTHVNPADQHIELQDARTRIATAIGAPVTTAACPFGAYNRKVLRALRTAGYRTVFTSDARPAHSGRWLQPRYSVEATDTPESVRTRMLAPRTTSGRVLDRAVLMVKAWR